MRNILSISTFLVVTLLVVLQSGFAADPPADLTAISPVAAYRQRGSSDHPASALNSDVVRQLLERVVAGPIGSEVTVKPGELSISGKFRVALLASNGSTPALRCNFQVSILSAVPDTVRSDCAHFDAASDLIWYRLSLNEVRNPRVKFSAFYNGEISYPLYRDHRMDVLPDPQFLLAAATAAGEYLRRSVKENGSFVYSYSPVTGRDNGPYNILRHAGTVYSMFEVYEVTRSRELLLAAEQALEFLVSHLRQSPFNSRALTVVERSSSKLGGDGLALLALSRHMLITGSKKYADKLEGLALGIQARQRSDGSFVHKVMMPSGKDSGFKSNFYPGEAIFALVRYYQLSKDMRWLSAAEKAADYRIERALSRGGRLTHDHWLLYGLSELYPLKKKATYLNYLNRLVNEIIASQITSSEYLDWIGGYYSPPASTPTATRSEGLCAVHDILKRSGDASLVGRVKEAVERGVLFQLYHQFGPEMAITARHPQAVLGGFRESFFSSEIRIDYVQHNVSSILCLRRLKLAKQAGRS